jgi:RNA recognition motif-containing protein
MSYVSRSRNLPSDVDNRELREMFAPYGEIQRMANMSHKKGIAFVTYVRSTRAQMVMNYGQARVRVRAHTFLCCAVRFTVCGSGDSGLTQEACRRARDLCEAQLPSLSRQV